MPNHLRFHCALSQCAYLHACPRTCVRTLNAYLHSCLRTDVRISVRICVHTPAHACVHTCPHALTWIYDTPVCTLVQEDMHAHICMHVCQRESYYTRANTHACIHVHAYRCVSRRHRSIRMPIFIYACTHLCAHRSTSWSCSRH